MKGEDMTPEQRREVRDLNRGYGNGTISGEDWRKGYQEVTGTDALEDD